ncbi:MAG: hypothetical protein JXB62_00510 [Pirellulales bacterium]|nr:hypothetical protein [Pirellulales bacterium]
MRIARLQASADQRAAWATLGALAALFVTLLPVAAQDTVTLGSSGGGQTKVSGRIVDCTGRHLRIQVPGGREQTFPADKVIRVKTPYGPAHTEADARFADGEFGPALNLYRQAVDEEPRRWVRRRIIARAIWCYRALDDWVRSGETFLLLLRDDPETLDFDCIPLEWMPRQPPAALEQAARQWLNRAEPTAVLLGASHLLTTGERLDALQRLKTLSAGPDRRVAQLALAQTWRAEAVTASSAELDNWQRVIEQMPQALAAGPYFVLGRARLQRQQWEQAALALMRVPILYPQQRDLATQALLDAGRALEKLGRVPEALRLYRELIAGYPGTRPMAEAQGRMEAIGN